MGKILSGILSGVSGKVAGVVGGRWKDQYYLRAHVKPANPNTAAQQTQRTKFSDCVSFCKPIVGQVFNAYTDKFIKSMSGFNFFIKHNIAIFDGTPDYTLIVLTTGPLSVVSSPVATRSGSDITIAFGKSLGNNGSDTDKMFAAVYYSPGNLWFFPAAEVDRSTETITVPAYGGGLSTDFHCYLWSNKYIGTVLDMISNSVYDECADA